MSMVRTLCLPPTEFHTVKFKRADISNLTSRGNHQTESKILQKSLATTALQRPQCQQVHFHPEAIIWIQIIWRKISGPFLIPAPLCKTRCRGNFAKFCRRVQCSVWSVRWRPRAELFFKDFSMQPKWRSSIGRYKKRGDLQLEDLAKSGCNARLF